MPINKDRFEELGNENEEEDPTPGTNAAKILVFLRSQPDKAFTQSEIASETEIPTGSIGPTLVRLRGRGRVDHHENYWRISDHDESVSAATGQAAAALAVRESDQKTPQMDEWQDYAVDPRNHRDE